MSYDINNLEKIINDSFLVDEKARITICIKMEKEFISTSLELKNVSESVVVFTEVLLAIGSYQYFTNEKGIKGDYYSNLHRQHDIDITDKNTIFLKPGERKIYYEQYKIICNENNDYTISTSEYSIVFKDTKEINITFYYTDIIGKDEIKKIAGKTYQLSAFEKTYKIKDSKQFG
jgi:hypothetical protein